MHLCKKRFTCRRHQNSYCLRLLVKQTLQSSRRDKRDKRCHSNHCWLVEQFYTLIFFKGNDQFSNCRGRLPCSRLSLVASENFAFSTRWRRTITPMHVMTHHEIYVHKLIFLTQAHMLQNHNIKTSTLQSLNF